VEKESKSYNGKKIMAKNLQITLVKSMIGRPEKHRKVLRGMGLTKLNKTVELQDTPEIRGMVRAVSHLVTAEEIDG
jgi:large subunit ribosomal protein L30